MSLRKLAASPDHLLRVAITLFASCLLFAPARSSSQSAPVPYACSSEHERSFPFCDTSLPISKRVTDLLSRLTLEEKVAQLGSTAPSVPRLGLPAYQWWSEALHGLSTNGPGVRFGKEVPAVTTFPQVILTAASFNRTLWNLIAQAVSTEARAMYNVGLAGLTFWSPNVNIFRDPRWGRGQETPGEDPMVASTYAVAYITGLQGQEYITQAQRGQLPLRNLGTAVESERMNSVSSRLKVSACCKHFIAYDLESWAGYTRYTFDALVTQQDLDDTFEPPFKSCVQDGQASCIMCSYNRVNGVPICADDYFLTQVARKKWGLNGYITSDCDAVAVVYEYIGYASSPEDAVADVLLAGLDLNCGSYLPNHTQMAMQEGKVKKASIDRALYNLFSVRMRLGMFDGDPKAQIFGDIGPDEVCTDNHRQLALEAARQGIVLLKNEENVLPLSKQLVHSIAVIGPNANASTDALLGNYAGIPCRPITPLEGLQKYADVLYQQGCYDVECLSDGLIHSAVDIALKADATILIVGLDQSQEKEDHDRVNLFLPGQQQELISRVANSLRGPTILVILSGGPVDISFARDSSKIQGILWAGYPGEAGGQAIAEVIFGDYNPGGRLPMTWYPQSFTQVPMTDMNMRPEPARGYPGRTYRFYTGKTVFNFGYGLSYTKFSHSFTVVPRKISLPLSKRYFSSNSQEFKANDTMFQLSTKHVRVEDIICQDLTFDVKLRVNNNGNQKGSHVVLLYSKSPSEHSGAPQKQLMAFEQVHLEAGADIEVSFRVRPCEHLTTVTNNGKRVLGIGAHSLIVDHAQHSISVSLV